MPLPGPLLGPRAWGGSCDEQLPEDIRVKGRPQETPILALSFVSLSQEATVTGAIATPQ